MAEKFAVDHRAVQEIADRNLDELRRIVVERFSDEQDASALIAIAAMQLGTLFQALSEDYAHRLLAEDVNEVLDGMPGVRYRLREIN
jgi:hypothetical protein